MVVTVGVGGSCCRLPLLAAVVATAVESEAGAPSLDLIVRWDGVGLVGKWCVVSEFIRCATAAPSDPLICKADGRGKQGV